MRKNLISVIAFGVLLGLATVASAQPCTDPGSILSVKNTSAGSYEYVTFRLKRPLNSGYGYSVSTVTGSFTEEPSGNSVAITGPKYKRIRFKGITWTCEIAESFSLPKTAIKAIKKLEQHEGIVVYVVGYRSASTYISTSSTNSGSIRKVVMKFKK
jgi:hypothetical protein